MSTREPLVSVVTPVYNGERHLREGIESVLLDIVNEYAARDPRIRIHKNVSFAPVIENHNIASDLPGEQVLQALGG